MADVYLGGTDQRITDPEWIRRASREGWVALTKDPSIVRDHHDVLAETTLRVFAFNNASLTGPEMVDRLDVNFNRILQRAKKPDRTYGSSRRTAFSVDGRGTEPMGDRHE